MADFKSNQERRRVALNNMPQLTMANDLWWIGTNDEYYSNWANTREEAIKAGQSDYQGGFYMVCARCDPVDLAAHFDVREFIQNFEDNDTDYLTGEGLDTVFHSITDAQLNDLEARIQRTIREWQIELQSQGVEISGDRFTSSSAMEYIKEDGTHV